MCASASISSQINYLCRTHCNDNIKCSRMLCPLINVHRVVSSIWKLKEASVIILALHFRIKPASRASCICSCMFYTVREIQSASLSQCIHVLQRWATKDSLNVQTVNRLFNLCWALCSVNKRQFWLPSVSPVIWFMCSILAWLIYNGWMFGCRIWRSFTAN